MTGTRSMLCGNCGYRWRVPVGPAVRTKCAQCDEVICACGCGESLDDMRVDAVFVAEAHAKALTRRGGTGKPIQIPDKARTVSIESVRAEQEESAAAESAAVRQAIIEAVVSSPRGEVHADDVDVPEDFRRLIGAQLNGFATRRWLSKTGEYRASSRPSRHGAGSFVYAPTELGAVEFRRAAVSTRSAEAA